MDTDHPSLHRTLVEAVVPAETFEGALAATIELVSERAGWAYGEAWTPAGDRLVASPAWHASEPGVEAFRAATERHSFGRGEGLPGRVWDTAAVECIDDVVAVGRGTFHRADIAARVGLRGAVGVPIVTGGACVAVLVFLRRSAGPPDGELLDAVTAVGVDLGALYAAKRAEDALERERALLDSVFETSPVGIVVVSADGAIERANGRAEAVLGLDREEITSRRFDDVAWEITDREGEPLSADELPVARVLSTGEPVRGFEHGVVADGEGRWLRVNGAPIAGADGDVERVVATIEDVTGDRERRRLLERQNERLDAFAGLVSHDLRGPLSVAEGYLGLAVEALADAGEAGGEARTHLDVVEDAHARMGAIVDDLLRLARLGGAAPRTEPVDLAVAAQRAWDLAGSDDATLAVAPDAGRVVADPGQLAGLLENLMANAVAHGPADVTVAVVATDRGFAVTDDGPGVPPGERERVLEAGYTTAADGTGFGLAIVGAVADAHGWTVTLDDSDAGGLRVDVAGVERP